MKKLLIILCIAFISDRVAYAPIYNSISLPVRESINPYLRLYEAICQTETHKNPNAYNALENAVGEAQIREIRIRDYNQETGKDYLLEEMYDPHKSREVFLHYATKYHYTNTEAISRSWNGGERGMSKESTKAYYKSVLKNL